MRKSLVTMLGTASMLLLAGFGCDNSYVKKLLPPSPPMEPVINSPDARLGGSALVAFGKEVIMSVNTKAGYSDGLTMEVLSVTDTRCPKDTVCEAPGAATVKVRLAGGDVGAIPKELTVILPGQVSAKTDGYFLFLGPTTSTTAALTLSKQQPKPEPTTPPGPPKEIQK